MAEKQDAGLIGYDPLAWIDAEEEGDEGVSEQGEARVMPDSEAETQSPGEPLQQASAGAVLVESPTLILESVLAIQNVGELYQQLLALLASHDCIELDASAVSSIDTAALQLLIALKKTAVLSGKDVVIDFPSEKFIEAADLLGVAEILGIERVAAGFF